jgi:tetratricopeptide (TPR) repeat protein
MTRTHSWRLVATLILLASTLIGAGTQAQDDAADDAVQQAVDAYAFAMQSSDRDVRLQSFARSERLFEATAAAGAHNADLQTNLGNAALQAERLGPAILAYRRALRLDPGHARARQNLTHARGLLPDWVPTPPEAGVLDSFFFWQRSLSRDSRANLAAAAFATAALLLAASIQLGRSWPRWSAVFAALVWLGLLGSLAFGAGREAAQQAVVVVPEVTARAADSINAPRRFSEPLPDGTELEILEDRGGWLHIQLHNGRDAWVTGSSVERV